MSAMSAAGLPKVSALMGAYNYGRYIGESIESAMGQQYPPELLELVIVDDGSTDDTAEVVGRYIERFPGRIKFVRQDNAGATAATNRARAEADGDLIALLDADDVWVPEKTRRQVGLMQSRPELGLVFSQMRLIDGDGKRLQDHYGHREPLPANQFARVLWENVAVQSSLIIDAELFDRIPHDAPYADWWLCLRGAQFKRIEYIPEDLVFYRWHGANITGGVGGAKALREAQKGIAFQRWVVRNFEPEELMDRLTPSEMEYVWGGLENQAQKGLSGVGSHFGRLTTVDESDREAARSDLAAAQRAQAKDDPLLACFLLWRARMCDPFDADLRSRFAEAVKSAEPAAALPDPLAGSGAFPVLADAGFLLADDSALRAYAREMAAAPSVTLVIDASAMAPQEAAAALGALVERCGLADDDDVSMIGVIGELEPSQRAGMMRRVRARYAAAPADGEDRHAVRTFTPESLAQLRELADSGFRS
jgi:glycosyltransferase involved in cell wall biosynthesis